MPNLEKRRDTTPAAGAKTPRPQNNGPMADAMRPLNKTINGLLSDAARNQESLRLSLEKGEVSMALSFTPRRNGKRRCLSFVVKD